MLESSKCQEIPKIDNNANNSNIDDDDDDDDKGGWRRPGEDLAQVPNGWAELGATGALRQILSNSSRHKKKTKKFPNLKKDKFQDSVFLPIPESVL